MYTQHITEFFGPRGKRQKRQKLSNFQLVSLFLRGRAARLRLHISTTAVTAVLYLCGSRMYDRANAERDCCTAIDNIVDISTRHSRSYAVWSYCCSASYSSCCTAVSRLPTYFYDEYFAHYDSLVLWRIMTLYVAIDRSMLLLLCNPPPLPRGTDFRRHTFTHGTQGPLVVDRQRHRNGKQVGFSLSKKSDCCTTESWKSEIRLRMHVRIYIQSNAKILLLDLKQPRSTTPNKTLFKQKVVEDSANVLA